MTARTVTVAVVAAICTATPQPGFTQLGDGECTGDHLWRRMSYVSTVPSGSGYDGFKAGCAALCKSLREEKSRCMGFDVGANGRCRLFDRDWSQADRAGAYQLTNRVLSFAGLRDGYPGIHMVRHEDDPDTLAAYSTAYACYRHDNSCESAPDCAALGRYACALGKTPQTCDYCLPYHTGTKGADNSQCTRKTGKPTLRISFGAGAFRTEQRDSADRGYNTMALSAALLLKHAWETKSPILPIPLEDREDFNIEFFGFTRNLKWATATDLDGYNRVDPDDAEVGLRAMVGATSDGTDYAAFDIREAPAGEQVHAVLGLATGQDEALGQAATITEVPVVGWNYHLDGLVGREKANSYVRVPRVASKQGALLANFFAKYGYSRIFVMSSALEPSIASQLRALMGPEAEIIEDGPLARSRGPCKGNRQCIEDLIEVWRRLRAKDARIIVHEHGGEAAEFIPLLFAADLLGPEVLYIQSGYKCFNIDFYYTISWGQAHYRLLDRFPNTDCRICPNIGVFGLSRTQLTDFTFVADWLYSNQNPYRDAMAQWCPDFPTRESFMNCSYCDATQNHFASPSCTDLFNQYEKAMERSFCVEEDLVSDSANRKKIIDYLGCADLSLTDCDDETISSEYVTDKLLNLGLPASYIQDYKPGGSLYEKLDPRSGTASRLSYPRRYHDAEIAEALSLTSFSDLMPKDYVDSILTVIFAYNDFVKLGGDADDDSDPTRAPVNQRQRNGVAYAWYRTITSVKFEGFGGPVAFLPTGERAVTYKLYQLLPSARSGCKVLVQKVQHSSSHDVVAANWNFKNTPDNIISGEAAADTGANEKGCAAYIGQNLLGKIALIKSTLPFGDCHFGLKAISAHAAGALAALIIDTSGDTPMMMESDDPKIKIPGFMIGKTKGLQIWDAMLRGETVRITLPRARCADTRNPVQGGHLYYGEVLGFDTKSGVLQLPSGGLTFNGEVTRPPWQEHQICGSGEEISPAKRTCLACAPGRFRRRDMNTSFCVECPAGYYAGGAGNFHCDPCEIGYVSNVGSGECSPCAPGSVWRAGPDGGAPLCTKCLEGMYQAKAAQTAACEPCPYDTFATGQGTANCSVCPGGSKTAFIAAISETACRCLRGQYYAGAEGGCKSCSLGMRCPGGLGEPLTEGGFYLDRAGSKELDLTYMVYRCSDEAVCPPDLLPNHCPTGRVGLACDSCQAGKYATLEGTCLPCSDTFLISRLSSMLFVVLLATIYFVVATIREPRVGGRQSQITLACIASISLTSLQVLGAFSEIQIPWMEPLSGTFLQVFKLDIDALDPTCVFPADWRQTALVRYVTSVSGLPVVLLCLFLMFRVLKCMGCLKKLTKENETNSYGKIVQMLFLGLCLVCLRSFQCISNPGGEQTMTKYRSVRCWHAEHFFFVIASGVGTLTMLVPFIAIVVRATIVHNAMVAQSGGMEWLKRYGFVFSRFRGEKHYYGAVHMMRSFLIALIPVVLNQHVQAQLLLMAAILAISLAFQAAMFPWRGKTANYLDAGFSCGLLVLLTVGSLLAPAASSQAGLATLRYCSLSVVGAGVLIGMYGGGFFGYRLYYPVKTYAIFLSHHKGGAAVLARFMKEMLLNGKVPGKVFLDSDELDNLDLVFSIVAENTKTFVLLLTAETLSRMWCAGELVSALRHKVKVLIVATESYEPPTDKWIDNLGSLWSLEHLSALAHFGIQIEDIQKAYRTLRTLPTVDFNTFDNPEEQKETVENIVAICAGKSTAQKVRRTLNSFKKSLSDFNLTYQAEQVLICGRGKDREAVCTVRVIQILLQKVMPKLISLAYTEDDVMERAKFAKYMIVVLTRGLLESPHFVETLHAATESGLELVPVLAETKFTVPDVSYYEALKGGYIFPQNSDVVRDIGMEAICQSYMKLFAMQPLTFTPHGSNLIQRAEIKCIASRFSWDSMSQSKSVESRSRRRRSIEVPASYHLNPNFVDPDEEDEEDEKAEEELVDLDANVSFEREEWDC